MQVSNILKSSLTATVLGCLALGMTSTSAFASPGSPVTTNIAVSATVQATCIVSATPLAFGTYISTAITTGTATVLVTCTSTTPYTVGLDAGATTGATVSTRQMKNGTALLNYGLFTNATWTTNWGNTTGSWTAGAGSGAQQTLTVYGQILANQYVLPGAYADTITATLIY